MDELLGVMILALIAGSVIVLALGVAELIRMVF